MPLNRLLRHAARHAEGDNQMVFCRSMPTTVCFVKKNGSPTSGKTKTKDKINILRDNVLKTKIRLRTKATIVDEI